MPGSLVAHDFVDQDNHLPYLHSPSGSIPHIATTSTHDVNGAPTAGSSVHSMYSTAATVSVRAIRYMLLG